MNNGGRKCCFCTNEDAEAHDGVRVCETCKPKFKTHIGVYCIGCYTAYWLPKTPANVDFAVQNFGGSHQHIMDNAMVMAIQTCKACAVPQFGERIH